jgi:DNA topoisomerase VI subunit B
MSLSTFERTTFETSRVLEFFSDKELTLQIGFPRHLWPIALLKELIDNALDACEMAGVAPEISITVGPDFVTVQDNGPGLPAETLQRSLDYSVRVSDKSYYVSPTRGQLGNALKCVWAAPYVADGERGEVEVTARGITHRIEVTLDRIAQQPDVRYTTIACGVVQNGTSVTISWPEIASKLSRHGRTGKFVQRPYVVSALCHLEPPCHVSVHPRGMSPHDLCGNRRFLEKVASRQSDIPPLVHRRAVACLDRRVCDGRTNRWPCPDGAGVRRGI